MVDIRLLARRRVCSRLRRGKLLSATRELSVKSMASCWSYIQTMDSPMRGASEMMYGTLVTPRFSIAGILYPDRTGQLAHDDNTNFLCRLTAKVELTFLDGIKCR